MAHSPIEEWKGKNSLDKGGIKHKGLRERMAIGWLGFRSRADIFDLLDK